MKAMLSPVLMIVLAESAKGALWYFQQMDAAGMAVAVVLLICSFIGWGAMIGKWSDFSARLLQTPLQRIP